MIHALNNGQAKMTQSKMFQKPLRNIDEYVDEPKVDIKKIKQMTGEINIPLSKKQWTLTGAVSQFYYDLKFYLGLDGKHEKTKREVNRNFVIMGALLVPVSFMCYQECQKYQETQSAFSVAQSAVPATLSKTQAIVEAARQGEASGVATAAQSSVVDHDQVQSTPVVPNAAPEYEIPTPTVASRVTKASGRNAAESSNKLYKSAEDFWRENPDLARSVLANKYGQAAAGQATVGADALVLRQAYTSARGVNTEIPAATSTNEAAAAAPTAAPIAVRQVSNAHNQSHM